MFWYNFQVTSKVIMANKECLAYLIMRKKLHNDVTNYFALIFENNFQF